MAVPRNSGLSFTGGDVTTWGQPSWGHHKLLGVPSQVWVGALSEAQFRELTLVKAADEVRTLELILQLH